MRPPGLWEPKEFAGMTDEELHQTRMESQPGSNYWELATAEQQKRERVAQNRKAEAALQGTVALPDPPEHRMKVFWSWQSDTPGETGRFLIRDALKDAIAQLKEAPDIEEPARGALHLDHDIQDVTGSPDLAQTIFRKIEASMVVVADVTLVGEIIPKTDPNKKLINSNVAIELGYALHSRTDQNVLLVFNKYYGGHEDLPFDLRHKGGAIVFDLRPGAERSEIDEQKKKLKGLFVRKLRPFLEQRATRPTVPFKETQCTFARAAYFEKSEQIAHSDRSWAYPNQSLCYLRLIPESAPETPIELAALNDVVLGAPLLRDSEYQSVYHGLNRYGAIKCTFNEHWLTASTQLFQNGELWCLSASLITTEGIQQHVKLPFLATLVLEQIYYDTVRKAVEFGSKNLGLKSPWEVEFGLVGVDGLYLYTLGGQKGPIRRTEIFERSSARDSGVETLDRALLSFFSKVFDSVGERRPPNLYGFPPDRPRFANR